MGLHILKIIMFYKFTAQNGSSYESPLYDWSKWEQWSSCSRSCGPNGTKRRSRACVDLTTNNAVLNEETTPCTGSVSEMIISCNEEIECESKDSLHISSGNVTHFKHILI